MSTDLFELCGGEVDGHFLTMGIDGDLVSVFK